MPSGSVVNQITDTANTYGVPPSIALAVAQQESGFDQNAVGSAGEIGIYQLMPATAAALGVDPSDQDENIQGGISLLAQLYQKYGNWSAALSANNSGSPTGSPSYANSVLSIAGGDPDTMGTTSGGTTSALDLGSISPDWFIVGGILLIFGVMWWARE